MYFVIPYETTFEMVKVYHFSATKYARSFKRMRIFLRCQIRRITGKFLITLTAGHAIKLIYLYVVAVISDLGQRWIRATWRRVRVAAPGPPPPSRFP